MSINKDSQKAPNLRFKGFTDDWEQRKLGEITTKIGSGKTPKGGSSVYVQAGIVLLRSQNIFDNKVHFDNVVYISTEMDNEMLNSRVEKNDVLLNITGASIGRSAVYEIEAPANVNQHVCIIRPQSFANPVFIQLNLSSDVGQKQIELNQAGGGREGLNFQQISKLAFNYPSLEEQKKIGKFFKNLDDTITLHQRKLDQLNQLKEALLQQMFPGKGETVPKLRFAGFEGDWEERKFDEFLEEFIRKSKIENEFTTLSSTNSGMEVREGRVSGDTNIGYKIIENDDLVLSPQNLWLGNINLNYIGTGLVSPSYKTFKIKNLSSSFLKPQLRSKRLLNQYELASTQGASVVRRNLDMELFYQITLPVPVIQEQYKIGKLFKDLDDYIVLQSQKVNKLKLMKELLLQNMFI